MNFRVLFVVAVALVAAVTAMCDKWGVRVCAKTFDACVQGNMSNKTNVTFTENVTDPVCGCFQDFYDCNEKYDCNDDAAYYVYHSACMLYKNGSCGADVCKEAASSVTVPVFVMLLSAVIYLFF